MAATPARLFFNGSVRTCDPSLPLADWVLVGAGRVDAVGRGEPPVAPGAARHDLRGAALVPGFHDAHVHLTWIATALLGCDLSSCEGVPAVLDALAAYRGPGRGRDAEWIVGYGFDETGWADPRLPRRAEIDAVEARRPVLLQRVCGHVGVVNSAALARSIPGAFTDLESGRLAEDDLYAVNDQLRPLAEDLERILPDVAATLHTHGITAVHDVMPPEMLAALRRAAQRGRLDMRVSASIPARYLQGGVVAGTAPGDAAAFLAANGLGVAPVEREAPWLRVLGIKLFLDGSLGARTAALREPYADAASTRGALLYSMADLVALACRVDAAGLQLMVHAIGDAALDQALVALQPLVAHGNPHRHRLEHVEVTPRDVVERLAASGLYACLQPNFAGRWSQPGGMNGQRLGARATTCNAYRTLRAAGLPLAFGSDCMPLGPLFGLRSAVQHPLATEALDAATALALYTSGSAAITHADARQGRIAAGFEADLVVLSHDPVTITDWTRLRIESTWLAGRRVGAGDRLEGGQAPA